MKIVNIEDYFHPDAGYQLNILSKYLQRFGHQVTIITAEMDHMPDYLTKFFGKENIAERDRAFEAAYGVRILRVPMRRYVSGRAIYTKELLSAIRACDPDILFVHDNVTVAGMWAIWRRKKLGYPLFFDNHMSEMASRNPFSKLYIRFYRAFLTPIIKKNQLTVVATAEDRYAENVLGVPRELSPLITFGSDTMLFHPDHAARTAFRKEHGISEDAFVVLYAGKMDESKGGMFLAQFTNETLDTDREIVYVVVGGTVGEYGRQVEETFEKSPYRVLRFPTQKYVDLPQFFQSADVALIPKQCSLSLFDFNSAGLPVLAEDNDVNVSRCSHGNGWTFRAGDLQDFKAKLEAAAALSQEEMAACRNNCHSYILEHYNYEDKAREFEKLFYETIARQTNRN